VTSLDPAAIVARNKSNYLQAKAAFNRNDIDACVAFYAVNHQIKSRPSATGREQIKAFFSGTHLAWPDIQIVVEQAVAEEDYVMGRSVATATHTTAVFGVQPTLRRIETTFWDLHRFDDDGLIVETWNLMDTMTIMEHLGLLPGPR
jgi:predicted ester cyclase